MARKKKPVILASERNYIETNVENINIRRLLVFFMIS